MNNCVSTIQINQEEVKYIPFHMQTLAAKPNSDPTCTFYSGTTMTLPPRESDFIYAIEINAVGYRNSGIDPGVIKTRSLEQNSLRKEAL